MEAHVDRKPDLNGWKEIADYLGITVRAAQKWEKEKGLPIRRMAGEKGRVFALRYDLDLWKDSVSSEPAVRLEKAICSVAETPDSRIKTRSRAIPFFIVGAAILISIIAATSYLLFYYPSTPGLWRVEGNTLIISNAKGREVWRKVFPEQLEASYSQPENNYRVWIGNLRGRGEISVLFALVYKKSKSITAGALICYSQRGIEQWRFNPGKVVSTATETFPDEYWPVNFAVKQMGANRPNSIVVSSIQNNLYPTQIAVLTSDGKLQREYWHSGIIGHHSEGEIAIADLDKNGINEIYLGGVNNSYELATLIVLDPDTMAGASIEESPKYQLRGFEPGRELARILFPKSCITKVTARYVGVLGCDIHDGMISVFIPHIPGVSPMRYDLNTDFRVLKLEVGDRFRSEHIAMSNSGKLDHAWSPETEERELRNIRIIRPSRPTTAVWHRTE